MGSGALASSGVTALILYLIKDRSLTDREEPLRRVRKNRVWTWLGLELVGFAATFARRHSLLNALVFKRLLTLIPALMLPIRPSRRRRAR